MAERSSYVDFTPAQARAQRLQRRVVEACADLPGVAQPVVLPVAHKQGPEVGARSLRRGVAADHELLLGVALELAPVARARGAVRAVRALGHDALEALAAGLAVHPLAVLVAVRREADVAPEAQRAAQLGLALAQRQLAHVAAVETQQIEGVEEDGHRLAPAALEALEARDAALVEGNHLAVDHEVPARLGLQCRHELRVVAVHGAVGPRHQPHRAVVAVGEAAHAVELALEDPPGIREGLVPEDGLHRVVAVQRFLASTARWSWDLFMRERPSTFSFLASL